MKGNNNKKRLEQKEARKEERKNLETEIKQELKNTGNVGEIWTAMSKN